MKQIVISVETQYLIVGLICLAAIVWMIISARRRIRNRKKGSACCGCSLSQTCARSTVRKKP